MKKIGLLIMPLMAISLLTNCGKNKYNITWQNDDGSVLATTKVDEGKTPEYDGKEPTKPDTEECKYTFDGWSPALVPANKDTTYTATYKITRIYKITWQNDEGRVLATTKVDEGKMPEYPDKDPSKESKTEGIEYRFTGWEPDLTPATRDTTYAAKFDEVIRVTFDPNGGKWSDGTTEPRFEMVKRGEKPSFSYHPDKDDDAEHRSYRFLYWGDSEELPIITAPITLKAFYAVNPSQQAVLVYCENGCLVSLNDSDYKHQINDYFSYGTILTLKFKLSDPNKYDGIGVQSFEVNNKPFYDYNLDDLTLTFKVDGPTNLVIFPLLTKTVAQFNYSYDPNIDSEFKTLSFSYVTYDGTLAKIDWGDGITNTETTHTYSGDESNNYIITVIGNVTSIQFADILKYSGHKRIIEIALRGTINSVEKGAFNYASMLKIVTLSKNVISIGDDAFREDGKMEIINFSQDASLTSIGLSAFRYCFGLRNNQGNVYLPSRLKEINVNSFFECSAIKRFIFSGNNLSYIKNTAFHSCLSLVSIDISTIAPSSTGELPTISADVFEKCSNFEKIYVNPTHVNTFKNDTKYGWGKFASFIKAKQ